MFEVIFSLGGRKCRRY